MRPLVVSLTFSLFVTGCDARTETAPITEDMASVLAADAMVNGLLSFDAGMLVHAPTASWPTASSTSPSTEEHDKGFEPAAPITPGIPLNPNPGSGECAGEVTACLSRSITSCLLGEGCVRGRGCVGARAECGSAYLDSDSCARAGCTWAEHCEGEATPCSLLEKVACVVQPGCGYITP